MKVAPVYLIKFSSLEMPSAGLSCTGLDTAFLTEGLQGPSLVQGESIAMCFYAVLKVVGYFLIFFHL